jgi:hypothetical protein
MSVILCPLFSPHFGYFVVHLAHGSRGLGRLIRLIACETALHTVPSPIVLFRVSCLFVWFVFVCFFFRSLSFTISPHLIASSHSHDCLKNRVL